MVSNKLRSLIPPEQLETTLYDPSHLMDFVKMNSVADSVPEKPQMIGKRHRLFLHYSSFDSHFFICSWDGGDEFYGYELKNEDLNSSKFRSISLSKDILSETSRPYALYFGNKYNTVEEALYDIYPAFFPAYAPEGGRKTA